MELKYAMNTLYVLGAGILVMFMALGLVVSKNPNINSFPKGA
jgi:hypothetical protein